MKLLFLGSPPPLSLSLSLSLCPPRPLRPSTPLSSQWTFNNGMQAVAVSEIISDKLSLLNVAPVQGEVLYLVGPLPSRKSGKTGKQRFLHRGKVARHGMCVSSVRDKWEDMECALLL